MTKLTKKIVGRQSELNQFENSLIQGYGLLGFYGLGGIGKTTLLLAMREICHEKQLETVWIDGSQGIEPLDLIGSLIYQLAKSARIKKWKQLESLDSEYKRKRANLGVQVDLRGTEIGTVETGAFSRTNDITIHTDINIGTGLHEQQKNFMHWAIRDFVRAIRVDGIKVTCLFDSLEWFPDSLWQDISFIASSLAEVAVVVCAGRKYDTKLTSQLLDELPEGDARQLLSSLNVQKEFQDAIVEFTRIPRCLELSARYSNLPDASPLAFSVYNVATDDVLIVTDYIRKLILDRLKGTEEYTRQGKTRGIVDLLEYGCVLTELTSTLIIQTLGKIEPFSTYLADRGFVQELLSDGLLKAHLVNANPPYFHDLIRDLATATLKHEEYEMYRSINLKAAEHYAWQLVTPSDDERIAQLLQGELSLELTIAHLHDQNFAKWRQTFLKFYKHLSRANAHAGITLARKIFQSVFFAHYQPLCEQILRAADANELLPRDRAWLLTESVAAGLSDPEETLKEVLSYDISEIGQGIWTEAATRLIHMYLATGKPHQAQELLEKVERLGKFSSGDEAAKLYSRLASTYSKSAHYKQALSAAQKAVSLANDEFFRAHMTLQVVITLRRLKDYAGASALAKQILPSWERLGEIDKLAETHIALGDVYRFAGNWPEARDAYQQATEKLEMSVLSKERPEAVREQGHRLSLLGTAYGALSRYYIKVRQLERAEDLLHKGIKTLERGGGTYFHYGWMKRLLAITNTLNRNYSQAIKLHHEAIEAAKRAGNYLPHQIENLICLRNLHSELNDQSAVEEVSQRLESLISLTEIPISQWEADVQSDVSRLDEGS